MDLCGWLVWHGCASQQRGILVFHNDQLSVTMYNWYFLVMCAGSNVPAKRKPKGATAPKCSHDPSAAHRSFCSLELVRQELDEPT